MVQAIEEARRRGGTTAGVRIPPHNLDAEKSLLGAMLLSRDAIAAAMETCRADDFYKPAHAHVFDAINTLYNHGDPADPVTVADELTRVGLLESVGGLPALVAIQADTPATTNASRYARIVEEHSLLRRLISVAGEMAEMGYSVPEDVSAVIDRAEALVFNVAERRVTDSLKPLADLLMAGMDRLAMLYEQGSAITGVPTGYVDLDEKLYGLQRSNLIIIGARPAMGKTAFALGMAAHAAMEAQVPTLVFSLEMGCDEITNRLLVSEARVDAGRMRNGNLADSDWPKISAAVARLGEAPLFIDDNPNTTVMEIRAKARRLKAKEGGLGLIIIDYLQLMQGNTGAENRQLEVSAISRGLKILARELEVPVVALSQLTRGLEARADKRPMLADLRESGCMPASTRLLRADNGEEIALGELVLSQETPLVWSLDEETWKLVPRRLLKAFPSGVKHVFRLRLRSGLEVKASGNHPFRTVLGWRRLDQLRIGDFLAVPRAVPAPVGDPAVEVSLGERLRAVAAHPSVSGDRSAVRAAGGVAVAERIVDLCCDPSLTESEQSDVFWDEIESIAPLGEMRTYDATVEGTHNFVANGVVAHNSLEQDADVVLFLYRDEMYNPESADRGSAEVIVAKHRNGPTGKLQLAFLDHYTRFANMARV